MILLSRPYRGYAAGATAQFDAPTEEALVAQGFGTVSTGNPTPGAQTVGEGIRQGRAACAVGASSVVITHPECTAQSTINAYVAQAAADGTALRVERVVPAAGSFTVYLTANATAATQIAWELTNISGSRRN